MLISGIYLITNTINNKKYIGQSVNISRRWSEHKNSKYNQHSPITRAIEKYKLEHFEFRIFIIIDNINMMNFYEEQCIEIYDTLVANNRGYNIKKGGDNHEQHESTKKKIGQANKGRFKNICWDEKYGKEKSDILKLQMAEIMKKHRKQGKMFGFGSRHKSQSKEKTRQSIISIIADIKLNDSDRWRKINNQKSKSMKNAWITGTKTNKNMAGKEKTREHKEKLRTSTNKFNESLTREERLERNCNRLRKIRKDLMNKTNEEIIKIFQQKLNGNIEYQYNKKVIKNLKNGTHWSLNNFI